MIFDTHAHYDDAAFDADREEVLRGLSAAGVSLLCDIGASLKSSRAALKLAQTHAWIYAAVGVHPDECGELDEAGFAELTQLARSERCVAIGEIGLDYHGFDLYENKPSKELQLRWFKRQLELAAALQLPAVIHSRNACEDTLTAMRWAHDTLGLEKAVIHCFSYSRETALQYVELGYLLGFGGSVTYEGQKKISKVLNAIPLASLVLETDCPYLAPVPRRGERNQSGNLVFVRDRIAQIRGCSPEEIETAAFENGCRLYGISQSQVPKAL